MFQFCLHLFIRGKERAHKCPCVVFVGKMLMYVEQVEFLKLVLMKSLQTLVNFQLYLYYDDVEL